MKGFLSDNSSSVHKNIMAALIKANEGHMYPYGADPYTLELETRIKELFGEGAKTTVVLNGTGANVLGLSSVMSSFHSILTVDASHVNVDECGSFEKLTGGKIIHVPHVNGKLQVELLEEHLKVKGNFHHNQPRVISISQVTEFGSVYTQREIREIADFAHEHGLLLHVDGARIANACVSLKTSFKEMITDTGVDLLSFGGTKNGLMYGELIISFNEETHERLGYLRKQGMQLASKMRYISAQFLEYLNENLWRVNAVNANEMCKKMYSGLKGIEEVEFLASVDANIIFAKMPLSWIEALKEKHYFYIMDEANGVIRLVTSFDTDIHEVESFLHDVKIAQTKYETMMY